MFSVLTIIQAYEKGLIPFLGFKSNINNTVFSSFRKFFHTLGKTFANTEKLTHKITK